MVNWAKIYSMSNVSLRFFNAYGPRSSIKGAYGSVFGIFLAQKLAGQPLTIVGDGKQTRDFVHVFDLVEAAIKAIKESKPGKIYNVGNGKETSINFIAENIGGDKVNVPLRPGEVLRSLADISKINRDLNWKPKIKIDQGIKMLINNINNWSEAKVWTAEKMEEEIKNWSKSLNNLN